MAKANEGGPAFPVFQRFQPTGDSPADTPTLDVEGEDGMSLRDYFAAKAMVAIIGRWSESQDPGTAYARAAERAYAMADEMLVARHPQP